jgi:hypothetical protein
MNTQMLERRGGGKGYDLAECLLEKFPFLRG